MAFPPKERTMRRIYLAFLCFTVILAASSVQPNSKGKAPGQAGRPLGLHLQDRVSRRNQLLWAPLPPPRPSRPCWTLHLAPAEGVGSVGEVYLLKDSFAYLR